MKHVTAIIIKFVIITLILEIILGMVTNLTFYDILYISVTLTVLAYIIGDLFILSASNNTVATITDVGLAWFTIYIFRYVWDYSDVSLKDAFVAASVIGIGEWFFHKYVGRKVFPDKTKYK